MPTTSTLCQPLRVRKTPGSSRETISAAIVTDVLRFAHSVQDVDQRLDAQSNRLWTECILQRFDFDRPWRTAASMRRVTRGSLLAFFDKYIAPEAPSRRRLSTHVFAQGAAPSSLQLDELPEDYYGPRGGRRIGEI